MKYGNGGGLGNMSGRRFRGRNAALCVTSRRCSASSDVDGDEESAEKERDEQVLHEDAADPSKGVPKRSVVAGISAVFLPFDLLRVSSRSAASLWLERMEKSKRKVFITYYTSLDIESARDLVRANASIMREPDTWLCDSGATLFQKRYAYPDPYYAQLVWKNWDPKPLHWVLSKVDDKRLDPLPLSSDKNKAAVQPVRLEVLDNKNASNNNAANLDELVSRATEQTQKMGLACSLKIEESKDSSSSSSSSKSKSVLVASPANCSVWFGSEFIRNMLGVAAHRSLVVVDVNDAQLLRKAVAVAENEEDGDGVRVAVGGKGDRTPEEYATIVQSEQDSCKHAAALSKRVLVLKDDVTFDSLCAADDRFGIL